jgi:hypothetical protein
MPASEARVIANRQNALRSTGPKTVEGKERSRQNSLKHGMTGQGVVLAPEDSAEVERRNATLKAELSPRSAIGEILVRQLATLSVRMERGATQEFASVAARVRHAAEEFVSERIETAEALMKGIGDEPRLKVRLLKRMPEGVALLVEAWQRLRADLIHPTQASWSVAHLTRAANLTGLTAEEASGSRLSALSMAAWGAFRLLAEQDGAGLDPGARKAWAQSRLVEWVDREIASLEAHGETLDHEAIEQDRAQAGDRALFDPSQDAARARRYESEARRGFFRALEQFRQVEVEAELIRRTEAVSRTPEPVEICDPLASSRETASPALPLVEASLQPSILPGFSRDPGVGRGLDGRVVMVGRSVLTPA